MSTCKFFLQGTCKFGDSCKFSHQINDTSQSQGASIMRQQSKSPTIDTTLLVKSVVTDMINAEKGGHWLLSSYAPFKDKPCFPGFENRSFEEVRHGYYEAMKNGNIEQYKQQLQIALQEAAMKMKALQNPSNEIVSMLIQIYNTPVSNQSNTPGLFTSPQISSPFNQNQSQNTSIFAIANQQLFGNTPNQQFGNVSNQQQFGNPPNQQFGNPSNQQQFTFGGSPTNTNIFSGAPKQSMDQNIFGGNQSIFNKQVFNNTTNNSMFGNQNLLTNSALTNQNTPFAGQSNSFTTQNNMFSQPSNTFNTNNVFNSQPQSLPFQNKTSNNSPLSNQAQSTNNSIFSSQNQPFSFANASTTNMSLSPFSGQGQQSIFTTNTAPQSNTQNSSIFQQTQQSSSTGNTIFDIPVTTPNIFGGQTSSNIFASQSGTTQQKPANSIFGQTTPQISNTDIIDSNAYSKLEDLSENDIKSFQSDSFEFGKIPEKPPTIQMCN